MLSFDLHNYEKKIRKVREVSCELYICLYKARFVYQVFYFSKIIYQNITVKNIFYDDDLSNGHHFSILETKQYYRVEKKEDLDNPQINQNPTLPWHRNSGSKSHRTIFQQKTF